ncbi:MAG TPA: hypothetical protein VGZ00_09125 [Candidatus Baltobacteraceae bacterium]|jgi:hypothetical protein|nr:hypothetical protein [Candidatus Baltobacteraceae bacterium]
MGILPIIVFGHSFPGPQACDFASAVNANGFSAAIAGSPQYPARPLDGVLTVSFDPSHSSDQAIAGAADTSLRSVEVQQAGINPIVLVGTDMLVTAILIIGYRIFKSGKSPNFAQIEKMLTEKIESIEKANQVLTRQETFLAEIEALKNDANREDDAAAYAMMSAECVGVKRIQLGIFPVRGDVYASCIIMDAPSRGTNLFISSFPPQLGNLMEDDGIPDELRALLLRMDPHGIWSRGEYPVVRFSSININVNLFSPEYRKHPKTLTVPPGMTVHDYALAILKEVAFFAKKTFSLSADERAQGVVCYSNRLLSTILQGAGGETAEKNINEFLKELHLVSKVSNTPASESIAIPGLGKPFPLPSQVQEPDGASPERKPRGFL